MASRAPRALLAALLALLLTAVPAYADPGLAAGSFAFFLDINTTNSSSPMTSIGDTLVIGDVLYFEGMDATYGADMYGGELWRSDGSAAGTYLVRDINPGKQGASISQMVALGNVLMFVADDGIHGRELWRSDGTAAGTYMVRDIVEGRNSSEAADLTPFAGFIYFAAHQAATGVELWRSDGTEAGTQLVEDMNLGADSSTPGELTVFNGKLYFAATVGGLGRELYTADSTIGGASLYEDVWNGLTGSAPHELCACGSRLYFAADHPAYGVELWRTTGAWPSDAGLVEDINPAAAADSNPANLTCAGTTLYFAADDGTNGVEPWKSSGGTAATTQLAANINAAVGASSDPSDLTAWDGAVYFAATSNTLGRELYKATTVVVPMTNIHPTGDANPEQLAVWNGSLYFSATDGVLGHELWVTGSSTHTAQLVADINLTSLAPGTTESSAIQHMTPFGDRGLYFSAFDGKAQALWATGGSATNTHLVSDLRPGATDSWPTEMAGLQGRLHFTADDGATSWEPWISDGTVAGTQLLKNIAPDTDTEQPGSMVTEYVVYNGLVYFAASDPDHGRELWRTNGTAAGTVLVADIRPGADSAGVSDLTIHNGYLYFVANDGTHGYELWRTDGVAILSRVRDIYAGSNSSYPDYLTSFGGFLYFRASEPGGGAELWRSDGTEGGTVIYKDLVAGGGGSSPSEMTVSAGRLCFVADGGDGFGRELWYTTGSAIDTYRVTDLYPGADGSFPSGLIDLDGALYFAAAEPTLGRELWRYTQVDGISLVKDVCPGLGGGLGAGVRMATSAGWLWFAANDCSNGTEVWASDGTPAGTAMRADVRPGPSHSNPGSFATLYDRLFFRADDGSHGYELWSADLFAAHDDVVITERNQSVIIPVLSNDAAEPDATIAEFTQPDHGVVVVRDPHLSVEYSPEIGYSGITTFTYTIDGYYGSETATVTVYVDPPDVYLPYVQRH